MLGNANAYIDIFNANKDQLTDPDTIKPGQVLKIPAHAHHSRVYWRPAVTRTGRKARPLMGITY